MTKLPKKWNVGLSIPRLILVLSGVVPGATALNLKDYSKQWAEVVECRKAEAAAIDSVSGEFTFHQILAKPGTATVTMEKSVEFGERLHKFYMNETLGIYSLVRYRFRARCRLGLHAIAISAGRCCWGSPVGILTPFGRQSSAAAVNPVGAKGGSE